ncbi:hypothetical protein Clacol_005651 [Clathrus columnatus]|uniref:Uncharacterized protein n=1 Tax=Clathrus columnatus TaxID=1419009 RepID=A0AAV5AD65_9AGAM|nr:hypothetical protein Clacol_005651 [Clathrus columnatus]
MVKARYHIAVMYSHVLVIDWYDNEHAPLRLTVKGFHNALRYQAIDNLEPRWLALYDLDNPEIMTSDEYKSLSHKASEREGSLVAKLKMLNRRVYSLVSKYGNSEDLGLPSKYVLAESSDDEELRAEESINLISKVPGWIQSRRYKLVVAVELAGQADKHAAITPATFINVHYFDRPFDKPLSEGATREDIRMFALYKDLGKPIWK